MWCTVKQLFIAGAFTVGSLATAPCRSALAQPAPSLQRFSMTLENLSDYDLSPGGVVVHNSDFFLFLDGSPASPAFRSLCEHGTTADFIFFTTREKGVRNAFAFHGGAVAHETAQGVLHASAKTPFVSLAHKVSFTDDTCVAIRGISLFDEEGRPIEVKIDLIALDAGTRENLHLVPPRHSQWRRRLGITAVRHKKTEPPAMVSRSALFQETVARVIFRPSGVNPPLPENQGASGQGQ